jgi:hypothetical protein
MPNRGLSLLGTPLSELHAVLLSPQAATQGRIQPARSSKSRGPVFCTPQLTSHPAAIAVCHRAMRKRAKLIFPDHEFTLRAWGSKPGNGTDRDVRESSA